jgi:predicted ArsR family transcriptional regulator
MPAARRRTLELLLVRRSATTTDLATELGLPTQTTRRLLEDLTAHRVLERESQGGGKPDRADRAMGRRQIPGRDLSRNVGRPIVRKKKLIQAPRRGPVFVPSVEEAV